MRKMPLSHVLIVSHLNKCFLKPRDNQRYKHERLHAPGIDIHYLYVNVNQHFMQFFYFTYLLRVLLDTGMPDVFLIIYPRSMFPWL